jgi:hypothetical protein
MKTAHRLHTAQAVPESEHSTVRKCPVVTAPSAVAPAQRHVRLSSKLISASAIQRRLPAECRKGQLLAIAILRRDELLLDELLRRVTKRSETTQRR